MTMVNTELFEPRWASAPGATIVRTLADRGYTTEDLADWTGLSDPSVRRIVTGESRIVPAVAEALASHLGGSADFWLRRDALYQEHREWTQADSIAEVLPVRDMVGRGWIPKTSTWRERARACLEFFGVESATEWESQFQSPLQGANFRRSDRVETDVAAVAVWLRQAERVALGRNLVPFAEQRLRTVTSRLRYWSREPDPAKFIPGIESALAEAGVALVVLRTPTKCPVSGAAKRLDNGTALIALSGRYLADDHFWFTLFHEIAHLLLHGGADGPFVDELEAGDVPVNSVEQEADEFAGSALVPSGVQSLRRGNLGPSLKGIVAFAQAAGVSPGIIVGQLQHAGIISFGNRNELKRRYRWDPVTGELVRKK